VWLPSTPAVQAFQALCTLNHWGDGKIKEQTDPSVYANR
jgi:hypothetical protein